MPLLQSEIACDTSQGMRRRDFLKLAPLAALPAPAFQSTPSKMKITGVRLVHTRPKRPIPAYKPAAGSWSTGGVEVANPMSIYPEYKAMRSLFQPMASCRSGCGVARGVPA